MAKKKSLTIEQRAERYRKAQHELAKIKAAMDAKISDVAATYEAKMKALLEESESDQAAIMKHVETYRGRMFPNNAKSTDWQGLKLAFKLGGKSVKIAEGFTEDRVIKYIADREEFANLIKTKTSIDKPAIKKANLTEKELKAMGLEITQTETLTIKI